MFKIQQSKYAKEVREDLPVSVILNLPEFKEAC